MSIHTKPCILFTLCGIFWYLREQFEGHEIFINSVIHDAIVHLESIFHFSKRTQGNSPFHIFHMRNQESIQRAGRSFRVG